ncbi:apoptosis regulator BAX [Lepisosteus oculatus]|uniref:Zgc:153993 n=1 Tax=Lepisosteus oculatus TaxID=7918 RepID=W5MCT6_LEPOC|nr:PREDICTED: apoptosis regulator BAX [Lepisosteus oculatus]
MADSTGSNQGNEIDENGAVGGEDTVDDVIIEQGAVVFRGYVVEAARVDNQEFVIAPEDLGGRPNEGQDSQVKDIVRNLIEIADELNRNAELESLLSRVEFDSAESLFFTVARKIFEDGINWGRVVALFHLAYKLIIKAITRDRNEIIQTIIGWVLNFIGEHVSRWIREHGGWEGVRNYSQNLRWQNVAIFAAAVLTGVLAYWKMSS